MRRARFVLLLALQTSVVMAGSAQVFAADQTAPVVRPVPAPTAAPAPPPVAHSVKPAARPVLAPAAKPAPKATPRAVPRVVHRAPRPVVRRVVVRRAVVRHLTPYQLMMAAVAKIPTYQPDVTSWVISDAYGHWGTAVMGGSVVYISPSVPASYMYDVVVHEWSHMLSIKDYDGDVQGALDAMNKAFGGTDMVGAERAADCMALLQGAHWTHYTPCTDPTWRAAARRLVAGQRLS